MCYNTFCICIVLVCSCLFILCCASVVLPRPCTLQSTGHGLHVQYMMTWCFLPKCPGKWVCLGYCVFAKRAVAKTDVVHCTLIRHGYTLVSTQSMTVAQIGCVDGADSRYSLKEWPRGIQSHLIQNHTGTLNTRCTLLDLWQLSSKMHPFTLSIVVPK